MQTELSYHASIAELVRAIDPYDAQEAADRQNVLEWVESGAELCRIQKPDIPPKHLISYCLLFDPETKKLLLTDHVRSGLWLPSGGHVDPGEHPRAAALRECYEELGVEAELLFEDPLFLTITRTVGNMPVHTDVSLWYVIRGSESMVLEACPREFHGTRWFGLEELPLERTDPQLARFRRKLTSVSPILHEKRDLFGDF